MQGGSPSQSGSSAGQQSQESGGLEQIRSMIQAEMAKTGGGQQNSGQSSGSGNQAGSSAEQQSQESGGLEQIRSMIQGEMAKAGGGQRNFGQSSGPGNQAGPSAQSQQSASGSSSAKGSTSASQVGQSSQSKKAKIQPKSSSGQNQTVAEVLTQAQYELSEELQANLQKLRSVIRQSQEIAKKIELVLGHGEKGSGNKE